LIVKELKTYNLLKVIVVVISGVIAAVYYCWSGSSIIANFGGDNATYLLTANYFSPYSPASEVSRYFAFKSQYPPIYPLILALFGGGESILVAHIITTTSLLIAMVALYCWCVVSGLAKHVAFLIVCTFALLPGTLNQALMILSENTYLLFTLFALVSVSLFEKNMDKQWLWMTVGFIAAASLTRSAGISLISAFIIYVFLKKLEEKTLLSIGSVLPMLIWELISGIQEKDYLAALFNIYDEKPFQLFTEQILNQGTYLWKGWFLNITDNIVHLGILSAVGILFFIGAANRLRLIKLDGIYVFCYIGMILLWPYPAEIIRFTYVIIPVLMVQALYLLASIPSSLVKLRMRKYFPIIFLTLIIIVIIPSIYQKYSRFTFLLPENIKPYKYTEIWYDNDPNTAIEGIYATRIIIESLKNIGQIIPKNECIIGIKPSIIGLYTNRISYSPPKPHATNNDYLQQLSDTDCKYIYMTYLKSPSFPIAFFPKDIISDKITILNIFRLESGDMYSNVAVLGKFN